jgi:hypothetical protein
MRFTISSTVLQSKLKAIRTATENAPQTGLFATDIHANIKLERYYPAATAGECTPFAYDEAGTAKAFIGLLAGIAESGQDFPYQPQLGISADLQGHKALIFTRRGITPTDEAKAIVRPIPEALTFDELLFEIGTEIQATGARIVIIDDVAGEAKWCGNAILWDLNELADEHGILLLAGFMLSDETAEVNSWLARHAHNLLQLTVGSLNMNNDDGETSREQRYFCMSYGHPDSKRIFFGIDEQGNVFVPSGLWKLLRIKEIAQMFATQWISVNSFTHEAFGFLQGEFLITSIKKAIDEAAACGIIQKSGSDTKAKLILSDAKMSRSTNAGNIALIAKGNPYTNPNRTKQRKPILKFGEFKLIAPDRDEKADTVRAFTLKLIGAIVTGRRWLDFDVKTQYRNTLAIIVGANEEGAKWTVNNIATFGDGAKFEAMALPQGTTDEAFLTAYKQAIDCKHPDFVFILCYDRITPSLYTTAQLAKEIAIYSKRNGICTIAESEKEIDREANGFVDEYWSISPLVHDDSREDIEDLYGIFINPISSFSGSVGTFDFLSRFMCDGKHILEVSGKEQKLAFLVSTFYWADDTEAANIETDCTGNPLTNSTIYQAQRLGLIKVHYTSEKKKLLESRITFDGETAKRLMRNL